MPSENAAPAAAPEEPEGQPSGIGEDDEMEELSDPVLARTTMMNFRSSKKTAAPSQSKTKRVALVRMEKKMCIL